MLLRLLIDNYILINRLEMPFEPGLTVVTGETGAGKSIFIGALSLLLGSRAESGLLRNPEKKCIIEGEFALSPELESRLALFDWEIGNPLIVRRELLPNGKSRSFIQDSPVSLNDLKTLGDFLVDFNSQFQTLKLTEEHFQLEILDALAGNRELLASWNSAWKNYQLLDKKLKDEEERLTKLQADQDYTQYLFDELAQSNLEDSDELDKLEKEIPLLANAGELELKLSQILEIARDGELNTLGQMATMIQLLQGVKSYSGELDTKFNRVKEIQLEFRDWLESVQEELAHLEHDPQRLEEAESRRSHLYRLLQKHRLRTIGELMALRDSLDAQLQAVERGATNLDALRHEVESAKQLAWASAQALHESRKSNQSKLSSEVTSILHGLGMPEARFELDVQQRDTPVGGRAAFTLVEARFSSTEGRALLPVKQAASGGEMSRIMLAIKQVVAGQVGTPTILFDEIDTGISGEVARKVGYLMESMGANQQIIAITHLPQIASRGQAHWLVYKEKSGSETLTNIRILQEEERVEAIAKILSGENRGEAALQTARELLQGR